MDRANVKFFTTERDGKIALWVDYGDGPWNIWDLSKAEATPAVLFAVQASFKLGAKQMSYEMERANRELTWHPTDWTTK